MTTKLQNLVNHVTMIMDRSGSMASHRSAPAAFDKVIQDLKDASIKLDQETRVTIWLFGNPGNELCLTYDMDVMRFKSMVGLWKPEDGSTALLDAIAKGVAEAKKTPENYGDHAHLVYVFTDGGENASRSATSTIMRTIMKEAMARDNWTIVAMVPDQNGVRAMENCGFFRDNITTWDTTSAKGSEVASSIMRDATLGFMQARATGVRSSKSFFNMSAQNLNRTVVRNAMAALDPMEFVILPTRKVKPKTEIRDFVESWTKEPYVLGSAYHIPEKPIEVQNHKQILLRDKRNGNVFEGKHIRGLLGLPDHTVKVNPVDHPDFDVFIQSTSYNRHVMPDSFVLVRR